MSGIDANNAIQISFFFIRCDVMWLDPTVYRMILQEEN